MIMLLVLYQVLVLCAIGIDIKNFVQITDDGFIPFISTLWWIVVFIIIAFDPKHWKFICVHTI